MPKLKTKSGAKKRFKMTATGKVKHGGVMKRHRLINRSQAALERRRHDALKLGLRTGDRRRGVGEAESARSQEADRQRKRFIIGEDERRQLEAGDESIAAEAAALGDDRNAELLQHLDVAAERTAVDADAPREFRPADAAVGLQQLEHRQYTRGRSCHGASL